MFTKKIVKVFFLFVIFISFDSRSQEEPAPNTQPAPVTHVAPSAREFSTSADWGLKGISTHFLPPTRMKDGTYYTELRNGDIFYFPNPVIKFDFQKYLRSAQTLDQIKNMYRAYLDEYFVAYENEFLSITKMPKEYSSFDIIYDMIRDKLNQGAMIDFMRPADPPKEMRIAFDRYVYNLIRTKQLAMAQDLYKIKENTGFKSVSENITSLIQQSIFLKIFLIVFCLLQISFIASLIYIFRKL